MPPAWRKLWGPWLLLLPLLFGCALLAPSPAPVIPTPPPLTPVNVAAPGVPAETVVDPASDLQPGIDAEIAALAEAVSAQQLTAYVQTLAGFGTRQTFSPMDRPDYGVGAAGQWIYDELTRVGNGRLQVSFDDFAYNRAGITYPQRNIVAVLPGAGPGDRRLLLVAHYDSRSVDVADAAGPAPGANDNASGVALMLELARLLSARTWNHTLVFVAFAAEEQGTHGSRHFVTDRMLAGWRIDAVLNNDIVGGRPGIPQSVRLFTPGPDTGEPRQLARTAAAIARLYFPDFEVDLVDAVDRQGRFSDHMRFLDAGIPAVRLTESVEEYARQHSAGDTPERLDYAYLRQVAQLNLVALANMAGAPPPPESVTVVPLTTPGTIQLTWVPDNQAVGYAISTRLPGAPQLPAWRTVSRGQAGNVTLTGLTPGAPVAVSVASLGINGRLGRFSPESVVTP